jgi:antitoxin component HigA of HigAB toxin-antitoxin module
VRALRSNERAMQTNAPADFRDFSALIAYHGLTLYRLAPAVGLHPSRLSLILHGRAPLYPDVAERLTRAIEAATPSLIHLFGRQVEQRPRIGRWVPSRDASR